MEASPRPEGIPGVQVAGPFPVGQYAAFLRDRFKEIARVQMFGEVFNLRTPPKGARVYFELRDANGAIPCSMWRNEYEQAGVVLVDGAQAVVAGGAGFYPRNRPSSGSVSFRGTSPPLAGGGGP